MKYMEVAWAVHSTRPLIANLLLLTKSPLQGMAGLDAHHTLRAAAAPYAVQQVISKSLHCKLCRRTAAHLLQVPA